MGVKNHDRAVKYRRLAVTEPDKTKAALLHKIADEAERGVLCTVDKKQPALEITAADYAVHQRVPARQ